MNTLKRLRHLAEVSAKDRQLGKTTLIARAAKELDGVLLVHDFNLAKILERQHGVVTRSVYQNLDNINGPFFFDHYAVEILLGQAASKIENTEKELLDAKERILPLEKELLLASIKSEIFEKDLKETSSLLNKINAAIIRAKTEYRDIA